MNTEYTVSTLKERGSIAALFDLIKNKELPINQVSLAAITDEYITLIRSEEKFPLYEMTQGVVIIATLLLIKAKSLLPHLTYTDEEESRTAELEARLLTYKCIQEVCPPLINRFLRRPIIVRDVRVNEAHSRVVFTPDAYVSFSSFETAFKRMHGRIDEEKIPERKTERVRATITLEEMITSLRERIVNVSSCTFSQLASKNENKCDVIISFLALLELVKQGILSLQQDEVFNEITIDRV